MVAFCFVETGKSRGDLTSNPYGMIQLVDGGVDHPWKPAMFKGYVTPQRAGLLMVL